MSSSEMVQILRSSEIEELPLADNTFTFEYDQRVEEILVTLNSIFDALVPPPPLHAID